MWRWRTPPSGIRPPADPRGPPFDTFSEIHFCPTDPKIFLKAPLAPINTNFEGERAPKKTQFFLSKCFKKCPKTGQNTALGEHWAKHCFGRARKSCLFENPPPPPRENPRSAPFKRFLQLSKLHNKVWEICFALFFSTFFFKIMSFSLHLFLKKASNFDAC